MSKDIKIKKGLTIRLKGTASKDLISATRSEVFTIYPTDFRGIKPKLSVKVGDKVLAGDALFYSKSNEDMKFVSPVSGDIKEIIRGAKRKILAITINADEEDTYKDFGKKTPSNLTGIQIKQYLLESGCWAFINQRPYDILANPNDEAKAIFVSGFDTAPLAADTVFALQGKEEAFQVGIDAITKLTKGKVHLSVQGKSFLNNINGVSLHNVSGKHPAGNVGVQISKINPINAGERVWTVKAQDVAIIGNLFLTGNLDLTRIVALSGSEVETPKYYSVKAGNKVKGLIRTQVINANVRIINGNPLTGKAIDFSDAISFYTNEITVIPEGNKYRFLGWMPFKDNKIHSVARTSFAFLSKKEFQYLPIVSSYSRAASMEAIFKPLLLQRNYRSM